MDMDLFDKSDINIYISEDFNTQLMIQKINDFYMNVFVIDSTVLF